MKRNFLRKVLRLGREQRAPSLRMTPWRTKPRARAPAPHLKRVCQKTWTHDTAAPPKKGPAGQEPGATQTDPNRRPVPTPARENRVPGPPGARAEQLVFGWSRPSGLHFRLKG